MSKDLNDLIGKRFGKLIVLILSHSFTKSSRIRRYYICLCDCGNKKIVSRDSLITDNTKSCGCLVKETKLKISKKRFNEKGSSLYRYLYTMHKGHSKFRGKKSILLFEEYKNLIQQNCHYCGIPPANFCKVKNYYGELYYNGLDRRDNGKGYTIENSLPCCYICNRGKMDMKYEDFLDYLNRIKAYVG